MKPEDKAIKAILRGETPEKPIQVSMATIKTEADIEEEKLELVERQKRQEILQSARRPWFCPKCGQIMEKRLDDKMWNVHNMCFNCVVEFEHKLRVSGEYDDYEKKKLSANKLSFYKDMKQKMS